MIENQKTRAQNFDDETDMIDAFVACGGRMDKTGHVKRSVDLNYNVYLANGAEDMSDIPYVCCLQAGYS